MYADTREKETSREARLNVEHELRQHARMRVLLISHTCQSQAEAGQQKVHYLAQQHDVTPLLLVPHRWRLNGTWHGARIPDDASFQSEVGHVVWPWLGPVQSYLHWYPGLARLLKTFQPDILDLWEEPWSLVSAHACWLRNRLAPHTKIVVETEQNLNKNLPPPFEQFRAYTLRNADYAVARNKEAVSVLRAKGYKGPAEVVPNAVDADLFRPLNRAECRNTLGFTGFVAGYVGRMVKEKGLMDMVDALPLCPASVNLVFVGAGPFQDALEARVQQLGLTARVRFLPGRPLAELPRVMNALDALVLPSHTTASWKEQFGRVIIEAHACRTPVVGSDSGAIPDVVGEAGLIVPERDAVALAEALSRLHADPALAARLGCIGRQQVEENYRWQQVATRMRAIYHKVRD